MIKIAVHISRIIVGVIFIVSGFVKLTDPLGFSYKLQEYFDASVLNMEFLMPYALVIAMFVVILECVLGIMLLIGYRSKLTTWSLLLLIVFFTFLTFYSAYFNKVTDCGCFGDALKLTPWQSFTKDIILLGFILILFFGQKHIKPLFSNRLGFIGTIVAIIASTTYTLYMYNHLPSIDFRPYKIGNNILEKMEVPADAAQPIFDYHWKFNENGKEVIKTTRGSYPESSGTFIEVTTEMVQAGYEPPIHDYSMELNGEDQTSYLMNEEHLIILHAFSLLESSAIGFSAIAPKIKEAQQKGYKVIGMTASGEQEINAVKESFDIDIDFYFCDETTLKTMLRSNPGVMELSKGTILNKLHYKDIHKLNLKKVGAPIERNLPPVQTVIDTITKLD
jgi:uncharacterized membrane protein YphA (DoxX/SURF4 family)